MLHHVASGRLTDPVSASEQVALERWAEQGGAPPDLVASLLARIHRISPLACDCRGAQDPPLACVVRLPTSTLILRWYGPRAHAPTCIFRRQAEDRAPPDPQRSRTRTRCQPWNQGWDVLGAPVRAPRARSFGTAAARGNTSISPSVPRLARVLLSALQRTGYTKVSYTDLDPSHPTQPRDPAVWAKRIFRLLDEPVEGPLHFRDTSAATFHQLTHWLRTRLPAAAGQFRSLRPQGVLIGLVSDFDPSPPHGHLRGLQGLPDTQFTLPIPLRRPDAAQTGPWWVILQAAQQPLDGHFDLVDAYAHPAFSMALPIPVDSDAQRALIQVVLSQICFWRRYPKTSTRVSVLKPVTDIQTPHGYCRPDLLLSYQDAEHRRHALAIECMDRQDSRGLSHKLHTHPAIRSLPDVHGVFEYHPDALPLPALQRSLTSALFAPSRASSP